MEFENRRGYLYTNEGKAWHRIVCRKHHGSIPAGWDVHHVNGNSLDNRPENLIALPKWMHVLIHKRTNLPTRETLAEWVRKKFVPKEDARPRKNKKKKRSRRPLHPYEIEGGLSHAEAVEQFVRNNNVKRSIKLKVKN